MRMASFKITFLREKLFLANTHPKEIGPVDSSGFLYLPGLARYTQGEEYSVVAVRRIN